MVSIKTETVMCLAGAAVGLAIVHYRFHSLQRTSPPPLRSPSLLSLSMEQKIQFSLKQLFAAILHTLEMCQWGHRFHLSPLPPLQSLPAAYNVHKNPDCCLLKGGVGCLLFIIFLTTSLTSSPLEPRLHINPLLPMDMFAVVTSTRRTCRA